MRQPSRRRHCQKALIFGVFRSAVARVDHKPIIPGVHQAGWRSNFHYLTDEPFTHYVGHMRLFAKISAYHDERSARLAGVGLMLLSIFLFSFGDALGKYHGHDLFGRAVIVAAGVRGADRAAADDVAPARGIQPAPRPWLQLLRVTLSTLEVAAFFLATVYLPLADVITYYLACPIFVTALSAIVLREHVGWRRWSAILIGFCGVLIALRPSTQTVSWPAMIALGGSLSFAVLMLITRCCGRRRISCWRRRNSAARSCLAR